LAHGYTENYFWYSFFHFDPIPRIHADIQNQEAYLKTRLQPIVCIVVFAGESLL
jgi:hypothetical protein